ncbi:MAG: citramalate synthase [Acidimicrobiia bacterium]|nr:citramalate synthase [Acidimicrobiia bacterium]MYH06865.1 citramalate synthase [Acidimicrobiia bacterium]MYK55410.1 citramalate synthase [Acidimicrobiia bacterium]
MAPTVHPELEIYDTTLRDGAQQEGISLTVSDKLRIASLLDDLGVHFIEGGWPGALPKDDEFFARAKTELALSTSRLTAFGSTRRPSRPVEDDPQIQALLEAETEIICIVGKSWDYHVREALRTDLDEGIRMAAESVEYLKSHGRRVFFDAEHFFDGYRANPHYALAVLRAAWEAGAERLVLCDTNGGALPTEIDRVIDEIALALDGADLGVHFHDDAGCAVASSLGAAAHGVRQVQGCINGYGERTGNANLSTVIPDLVLKMGVPVVDEERLSQISSISHHIAEVVNITLEPHRPYVGASAFTHKAGLHTSALARRPDAYEHTRPDLVGNHTRMVISEQAGRAAVIRRAASLGLSVSQDLAGELLRNIKEMEHRGYQFEAADGTFELLVRRTLGWNRSLFSAHSFSVSIQHDGADGEVVSRAEVVVEVGGTSHRTAGTGVGPVHALDQALRAALISAFPQLEQLRLIDYRVRVLDSADGTSATVRVLIETTDGVTSWGTVGVHPNIIEASWEALSDGLTVGLLRLGAARRPPAEGLLRLGAAFDSE